MTAERHMVFIETERTGKMALTAEQFDMLLECALIGLEGAPYEGARAKVADDLFQIIQRAAEQHAV